MAERTEELILHHNPGWPKAGLRGLHPGKVEALDRSIFRDVGTFSSTVDVPFGHAGWLGRMRACNGVGAALSDDAVERFGSGFADVLAAEFPGSLSVPHRIFAASEIAPQTRHRLGRPHEQ